MVEAPEESKPNGITSESGETERAPGSPKINGHKHHRTLSDPEAQEMLIASLRVQIQDLFGQVTDLNNKLVTSYDRVSDLEDDLHVASTGLRGASAKISELELERTQHLSALDDGLLVEKAHVTAELTRLMEKATEEAAHRGQAESARADIEKDLDDLSATLFGQANTMVAEARRAQHISGEKLANSERALKGAEEAVSMMQQQMQMLQADKEKAEQEAKEAHELMGKGKWVERNDKGSVGRPLQLLSSHLPYQEFLLFVAYLRSVHLASPQVPAMTTLLTLPFLARMHTEDSEPTVRLDLAPSLNWLSRRSVLSAIHNGQLMIEPISSSALLQESTSSATVISSLNSNGTISCALCGTPVFVMSEASGNSNTPALPHPPALLQTNSNSKWKSAIFRKSSQSSANSQLTATQTYPPQIFIFRLASSSLSVVSAPPPPPPLTKSSSAGASSSHQHHIDQRPSITYSPNSSQSTTIYPLCTSKWCLARLRATCTLWAFVRTGIVEKIWEEEVPALPPPTVAAPLIGEKPPLPPRRRGLWGMASALNWGEGDKAKKGASQPPPVPKKLSEESKKSVEEHKKESLEQIKKPPPSPPPIHPAIAAAHAPVTHSVPPALPKRSEVRRRPTPSSTAQILPIEANELKARASPSPKPEIPSPTRPPHLPVRPPRRTGTPANVPLPESRPHTPPVLIASQPSSPSIPPSTSTPPPLPRRAAARTPRQPNVNSSSSRPVTPAPSGPPALAAAARTGGEQDKLTAPVSPHLEEAKEDIQELLTTPPTSAETHSKPEGATPIPNHVEEQEEAGTIPPPTAAETNIEAHPILEGATSGLNDVKEQEAEQQAVTIPPPTAADANTEAQPKAEVAASMPTDGASKGSPEKIELLPDGVMSPASTSTTSDDMFDAESNPSLEDVVITEPKGQGDESAGKGSEVGEAAKVVQSVESELQDVEAVKEDHGDGETKKESGEGRPEKDVRAEGEETHDKATKLQIETKSLDGVMKPVEDEETKPDEDKEVYVGDATWEERTWKEIVRLKEEMFWARLGGLRQ